MSALVALQYYTGDGVQDAHHLLVCRVRPTYNVVVIEVVSEVVNGSAWSRDKRGKQGSSVCLPYFMHAEERAFVFLYSASPKRQECPTPDEVQLALLEGRTMERQRAPPRR